MPKTTAPAARKAAVASRKAHDSRVHPAAPQSARSAPRESGGRAAKGPRFSRAPRRVVRRIEEQHDRLAFEIPKVDRDTVLVHPLEVGRPERSSWASAFKTRRRTARFAR